MNFLIGFLKGMALSVGAIAPGVSGGALAVIFGIYKRITDALAHVFKDFKKNVVFFFPIILGGIFGILVFSRIINFLFTNYNVEVKYLFIGLMVGTFPSLFKQANKFGFKYTFILPFLIALIITMFFAFIKGGTVSSIVEDSAGLMDYIIYGLIIGFGTIIPGISASFILMYLGAYESVINAIANIDILILIPLGIGFLLSIILFAKLINLLFEKKYGYTYYGVLGFTIGSIIQIFPGFMLSTKYYISALLLIIGFLISFSLCRYEKRKQ